MGYRNFYSNQYITRQKLHDEKVTKPSVKQQVPTLDISRVEDSYSSHDDLTSPILSSKERKDKEKVIRWTPLRSTKVRASRGKEGGEMAMTNNGIVNIQGKEYMTVARRVELAHENKAIESIETEVLAHDPVVVRAKVTVKGNVYTGISSVSLSSGKYIERQNPYEVAETSAVGRALGFAGYGLIESIASADEMVRATAPVVKLPQIAAAMPTDKTEVTCEVCGEVAIEKKGTTKGGKAYHGIFCSSEERSHTRWLWN